MSKRAKEIGSPLADWSVRDRDGNLTVVFGAVMERDKYGGYAFADSRGNVADFPPGVVAAVLRQEAEPAEAAP